MGCGLFSLLMLPVMLANVVDGAKSLQREFDVSNNKCNTVITHQYKKKTPVNQSKIADYLKHILQNIHADIAQMMHIRCTSIHHCNNWTQLFLLIINRNFLPIRLFNTLTKFSNTMGIIGTVMELVGGGFVGVVFIHYHDS